MNLYAIKVTQPCGEFEYPETDVFVIAASYTGEAANVLRKCGRVGCNGTIEHIALIASNVTIPGVVHPTDLY